MGLNYRSFEVKGSLRQSDSISTVPFNILLEKIIKISKFIKIFTLLNKGRQVTAYADNATKRMGSESNEKKTKFIDLRKPWKGQQESIYNTDKI